LALLVQVESEKFSEVDKHVHFTYLVCRTIAQH